MLVLLLCERPQTSYSAMNIQIDHEGTSNNQKNEM